MSTPQLDLRAAARALTSKRSRAQTAARGSARYVFSISNSHRHLMLFVSNSNTIRKKLQRVGGALKSDWELHPVEKRGPLPSTPTPASKVSSRRSAATPDNTSGWRASLKTPTSKITSHSKQPLPSTPEARPNEARYNKVSAAAVFACARTNDYSIGLRWRMPPPMKSRIQASRSVIHAQRKPTSARSNLVQLSTYLTGLQK